MYQYLKFLPGSNVVRILTNPYQYLSHSEFCVWGKKSFEQRLKCPLPITLDCPLCHKEYRPKPRWIIPVVSRRDDKIYLIDIGWGIFSNLKNYVLDTRWGDPKNYDIDFYLESNKLIIIPKSNMHLPFDKFKYVVNTEYLTKVTKPCRQSLKIIEKRNYEPVRL